MEIQHPVEGPSSPYRRCGRSAGMIHREELCGRGAGTDRRSTASRSGKQSISSGGQGLSEWGAGMKAGYNGGILKVGFRPCIGKVVLAVYIESEKVRNGSAL